MMKPSARIDDPVAFFGLVWAKKDAPAFSSVAIPIGGPSSPGILCVGLLSTRSYQIQAAQDLSDREMLDLFTQSNQISLPTTNFRWSALRCERFEPSPVISARRDKLVSIYAFIGDKGGSQRKTTWIVARSDDGRFSIRIPWGSLLPQRQFARASQRHEDKTLNGMIEIAMLRM